MATLLEVDGVVLRTLQYGEADIIAHLFTCEHGRRNVIAKGARRAKSRLGARLDPFMVVRVQLREGRGELAHVQAVEVVAGSERLGQRYELQQVAAVALDMLGRLSVEHNANEPAYHLTVKLLRLLDAPVQPDEAARAALITGYELKLLHLTGLAPHLGSCARCSREDQIAAWSADDGGVVCDDCQEAGDTALDQPTYEAAVHAMRTPLAQLASGDGGPEASALRAARRQLVDTMCVQHAGFRPRALA